MSKKKSKAREQVRGPEENEYNELIAEDGGEVTDELQEIYDYDQEKKQKQGEQKEYKDRLPAVPSKQTIVADTFDIPRVCDNCYLQDRCNHFEEGATCRFRTSVSIDQPHDIFELLRTLIEMQGERVIFGRFIEMTEGGYVDRNLSEEIKRLMEMMKNFKEILQEDDSINISIKGKNAVQGSGGILSEIFGGGGKKESDGNEESRD